MFMPAIPLGATYWKHGWPCFSLNGQELRLLKAMMQKNMLSTWLGLIRDNVSFPDSSCFYFMFEIKHSSKSGEFHMNNVLQMKVLLTQLLVVLLPAVLINSAFWILQLLSCSGDTLLVERSATNCGVDNLLPVYSGKRMPSVHEGSCDTCFWVFGMDEDYIWQGAKHLSGQNTVLKLKHITVD